MRTPRGLFALVVLLLCIAISDVVRAAPIEGDEVSSATAGHLVISEVMTGGASASDEFVELYNPHAAALPLEGLELIYVTASGATITR
ncbi:MAG: lamin tail domain-containing protein, partial [Candidatus Limnocylindria bacterium]